MKYIYFTAMILSFAVVFLMGYNAKSIYLFEYSVAALLFSIAISLSVAYHYYALDKLNDKWQDLYIKSGRCNCESK